METTLWYLTRASGLVAWVLLSASVLWGVLQSGRVPVRPRIRRWIVDIHPYLATVGLVALVAHIVTAVAHSDVGLTWRDAVVPFGAAWNPLGMALGVGSVWLLVAVEITSLMRRRLDPMLWRRVHLTSYAAAWLMAVHAARTGTDLRGSLMRSGALTLIAATTALTVWRVVVRADRDTPVPAAPVAPEPAVRTPDGSSAPPHSPSLIGREAILVDVRPPERNPQHA